MLRVSQGVLPGVVTVILPGVLSRGVIPSASQGLLLGVLSGLYKVKDCQFLQCYILSFTPTPHTIFGIFSTHKCAHLVAISPAKPLHIMDSK